jgi:hypothetical protein
MLFVLKLNGQYFASHREDSLTNNIDNCTIFRLTLTGNSQSYIQPELPKEADYEIVPIIVTPFTQEMR